MNEADPIRSFLDVRDLKDKGLEVVVSVVNEGEDFLFIRRVEVDISRDGQDFGRYPVSFPGDSAGGRIRLGQFEIAEGHFHLAPDPAPHRFAFEVHVDYKYGEHHDTQTLSRRVETQRLVRR